MRDKSFTYNNYREIKIDENLIFDIFKNARIIKEIEAKNLEKGDFYINFEENKLYYVYGKQFPDKIDLDVLYGGKLASSSFTKGNHDQIVKVLDVKKRQPK